MARSLVRMTSSGELKVRVQIRLGRPGGGTTGSLRARLMTTLGSPDHRSGRGGTRVLRTGGRSSRSRLKTSLTSHCLSFLVLQVSFVVLVATDKHAAKNALLVMDAVGIGELLREHSFLPFKPDASIQLQELLVVPALLEALLFVTGNVSLGDEGGIELKFYVSVCSQESKEKKREGYE